MFEMVKPSCQTLEVRYCEIKRPYFSRELEGAFSRVCFCDSLRVYEAILDCARNDGLGAWCLLVLPVPNFLVVQYRREPK